MSKSKANYIAVQDPPEEMFGKVMSIPDALLPQWWDVCLAREPPAAEPMDSKLALAHGIVEKWHGAEAAAGAERHFTLVVREHHAPDDVPEATLPDGDPVHVPALLVERLGLGSTSEARRLIQQGAVKVDGTAITEVDLPRERLEGATLQAGKRRFVRFHRA